MRRQRGELASNKAGKLINNASALRAGWLELNIDSLRTMSDKHTVSSSADVRALFIFPAMPEVAHVCHLSEANIALFQAFTIYSFYST